VQLLDDKQLYELKLNTDNQKSAYLLLMLIFSLVLSIEYVVANNIILNIDKIFPEIPAFISTILEIVLVQVFGLFLNPLFYRIVQSYFTDEFYITPFKILGVVNNNNIYSF